MLRNQVQEKMNYYILRKKKENVDKLRKQLSELTDVETTKTIISLLKKTKTNDELIEKL